MEVLDKLQIIFQVYLVVSCQFPLHIIMVPIFLEEQLLDFQFRDSQVKRLDFLYKAFIAGPNIAPYLFKLPVPYFYWTFSFELRKVFIFLRDLLLEVIKSVIDQEQAAAFSAEELQCPPEFFSGAYEHAIVDVLVLLDIFDQLHRAEHIAATLNVEFVLTLATFANFTFGLDLSLQDLDVIHFPITLSWKFASYWSLLQQDILFFEI